MSPRRPGREREEDPYRLLPEVGLSPGMTFADVGCGSGYFSLPAARIVGSSGRIYCVDANASRINSLKESAESVGLDNVVAIVGRGEDTVFCDGCVDIVFFGIALHDFEDPLKVLRNARRMVKPAGRLVNLDWKKIHAERGPPYSIRFDEGQASSLIISGGFDIEDTRDHGTSHYIITARPAAP